MARRTLYWHIGLAHAPRTTIGASLAAHREALDEAGVRVVATPEEADRATHDLLRTHRDAGLSRVEVEGQWARICDRVWEKGPKGPKGAVSVVSTPDLCAADKDQLRLALDPLIGVEVHLVVTADALSQQLYGGWLAELRAGRTTGWDTYVTRVLDHATGADRDHRQGDTFWAGHELPALLARWGWTFRADRLHVLVETDPAEQWRAFLELVGKVDADALPAVVPAYADPAGVAVLRRVNRQLDDPLRPTVGDVLTARDHESAAMPVVDTSSLAPVLARWRTTLDEAGYDVRGDLRELLDEGDPSDLPGPRDQLGTAVASLADALAENARLRHLVASLEAENARLDRKRRKHKRRLERLAVEQN